MSPQLIAGLVILFLTGLFGTLGYLVRGMGGIREDVREIKTTLGINGHSDAGLVAEVGRLRKDAGTVDQRITDSRHMLRNELIDRLDAALQRERGA